MTSHPSRSKFPFTVSDMGEKVAKFRHSEQAHAFAAHLAYEMMTNTEVHARDGIVGQYVDGQPTPEFACREDACRKFVI